MSWMVLSLAFVFINIDSVISYLPFALLESTMRAFRLFALFCSENDIHCKGQVLRRHYFQKSASGFFCVSILFPEKTAGIFTLRMVPVLYIIVLFLDSTFEACFLNEKYPLRA